MYNHPSADSTANSCDHVGLTVMYMLSELFLGDKNRNEDIKYIFRSALEIIGFTLTPGLMTIYIIHIFSETSSRIGPAVVTVTSILASIGIAVSTAYIKWDVSRESIFMQKTNATVSSRELDRYPLFSDFMRLSSYIYICGSLVFIHPGFIGWLVARYFDAQYAIVPPLRTWGELNTLLAYVAYVGVFAAWITGYSIIYI